MNAPAADQASPRAQPSSIPEDVLAQAADWIVRLSAGNAAEQQQTLRDFQTWQQQDLLHAAAADSMQGIVAQVQQVGALAGGRVEPARAAFQAGMAQRKRSGKRVTAMLVALACMVLLPAWLCLQLYPPAYLMADVRTATGQWRELTLSDGSHLTLSSAAAVNLRFDEHLRVVELVQGDILVQVAKDAARPFQVETGDGSIRALGTRFEVERAADATTLSMLESKVFVQSGNQRAAHSSEGTVVQAGERARITPTQVLLEPQAVEVRSIEDAWKFHQLVARNRPLTEILDEINRYRRGYISYDRAQLAGITMTVVLPLDDTDRALQLLVNSLSALRVRTLTPYLVRVDAPAVDPH